MFSEQPGRPPRGLLRHCFGVPIQSMNACPRAILQPECAQHAVFACWTVSQRQTDCSTNPHVFALSAAGVKDQNVWIRVVLLHEQSLLLQRLRTGRVL